MSAVLDAPYRVEEPLVQPRTHRFSVAEYYRMGEAGIFAPDQRVELIEGEVVEMAPIGPKHAAWVDNLNLLFARRVPEGVKVRIRSPVRLSDDSEPQPDLALLRPRERPYAEAHPGGPDTLLVIEMADTSLRYDREVKAPLYALRGVPELWLFDIAGGSLEIFREPSPDGYRVQLRPEADAMVAPAALPELAIRMQDLLGSNPGRRVKPVGWVERSDTRHAGLTSNVSVVLERPPAEPVKPRAKNPRRGPAPH